MQVQHNPGKFFIEANGKHAIMEYTVSGKEMDIFHTFTDTELRGQGLAEKLALAALEYAKKNGLLVVPTCDFVKKFLEKHSEYDNIVER
jgi:predicted GNAT family acetyltransferase